MPTAKYCPRYPHARHEYMFTAPEVSRAPLSTRSLSSSFSSKADVSVFTPTASGASAFAVTGGDGGGDGASTSVNDGVPTAASPESASI